MSKEAYDAGNPYLVGFSSGALAGFMGDLITHPIDTIKTRLQIQEHKKFYTGTFDAIKKIISKDGIRTFYNGFGAVSIMTVPAHALYFGAYEITRSVLQPEKQLEEKSAWVNFASGLSADFFGSIVWVPMDIAKQRLQVQDRNLVVYKNSLDVWTSIIKQDGLSGLYRGGMASLATYAPFVGVYFTTYEKSKKLIAELKNSKNLNSSEHLMCGFIAGITASVITCPLDVIKTNIQTHSKFKGGILSQLVNLYKTDGISAFVRGISARVLWISTNTAITIAFYEQFKLILNKV